MIASRKGEKQSGCSRESRSPRDVGVRVARGSVGATLAVLAATLALLFVPFASAGVAHVTGSILGSGTFVSTSTKGGKTYTTTADIFVFTGGISGNCTGSDTTITGVGPNGSFASDSGACTLVGSVGATSGTIVLTFASPVGFESNVSGKTASDKFGFTFSGGHGTGGLAKVHLNDGRIGTSNNNYDAKVQFG
jgi:hypothetical protein